MSLGKHALVNLAGNVLPLLVGLVSVPLYLSYIGLERYGVLSVIWALLAYFSFFDLGLGRAVSQRMSFLTDAGDTVRSDLLWTAMASTLALGLLGSLVLRILADFIFSSFVRLPPVSLAEAKAAVTSLLLIFPILLLTSVLQGALQARLRFVELNVIQVTGATLSQLFPLALAAYGFVDLAVLVPAALASRLLVIVLMFNQCRRFVPLRGAPRVSGMHLKPLLKSGGWFSAIAVLGPMLVTADRLVIGALGGPRAVAHYTVPYDLVSRTMLISGSLSSAIFPRLAAASTDRAKEMAVHATAVLVAVMTPVIIVGQFALHPFMILWVGPSFAAASFGVPELILLGVWVNALAVPHNARLLASGKARVVAMIYLLQLPIYLLCLYLGVMHYGIVGAAAAWTFRVVMDSAILLRLSGSLTWTLRTTALSSLLVTAATAVAIASPPSSTLRWAVAGLLLLTSTLKDKRLLADAILALKRRGAPQ